MSDHELLQAYVRDHAQPAFATLVDRHLNLVYSAACRQVHSPQLAEEIVQSVFIELARSAAKIPASQPLAAWLYVVTRRLAINARRQEFRRLARETTAVELAAMKTPPESWPKVAALLDDAMETLNETERTAIVLRFFENLSLREVGDSLGISEDTAQKRVSRALDRLRLAFARSGIAVTATGLATDLSAHSLQIAPVGLGATISTASLLSGAAGSTAIVATASKTIAMTTLQKSLLATACALALGTGLYEANAFARQSSEFDALQQQVTAFSANLQRSRAQQAAAAARLRSVEAAIDARLAKPAPTTAVVTAEDRALEAQMKTWLAKLDRLKQALRDQPELAIPELTLLPEHVWFSTAVNSKLETNEDLRRALASLRKSAMNTMTSRLQPALVGYLGAHDGALPKSVADLQPFFDPPIEPAWLERYEMLRTGKLDAMSASDPNRRLNLVAIKKPADVEYDDYWTVGTDGFWGTPALNYLVSEGLHAFAQANNGRLTTVAAELQPFLKWPAPEAAVQKILTSPARRSPP